MDSVPRERSMSFSDKHEVFLIGEQLRVEMSSSMLIKDRRYHLRTYKQCFAGSEVVEWLVRCKHCSSKSTSVAGMRILQNHGLFHHVCDDHKFKDDQLFYRFRRDDNSIADKDLALFYTGLKIYIKMTKKKGVVRDFTQNGQTYHRAFMGSSFVEWLTGQKDAMSKEEAIMLGRQLLEDNIIRHVTDDHHFKNTEFLLYQFSIEFDRRRILSDIFKLSTIMERPSSNASSISSVESQEEYSLPRVFQHQSNEDKDEGYPGFNEHCLSSSSESNHSNDNVDVLLPRSVMLRQVTADELESPDTPYVKQKLRIVSDSVGYGFVVRGDGPTYVQTVDPTGPAAAAGLKVRQYVYSVNGVNVLRLNHKKVGQTIMSNENALDITVLSHRRDALVK